MAKIRKKWWFIGIIAALLCMGLYGIVVALRTSNVETGVFSGVAYGAFAMVLLDLLLGKFFGNRDKTRG